MANNSFSVVVNAISDCFSVLLVQDITLSCESSEYWHNTPATFSSLESQ